VCVVEFGTDNNTLGAATGMVAVGLITAAWLLTDRIAASSPPNVSTGGPGDLWSGGSPCGGGLLNDAVVAKDLLLLPATEMDIR